ncbi:serine carboxypeptidase-like 18 isoform X3 [Andrographis paniculata]|uniref:serine carboxypeptidase-like 18 isoform X3 n=1 Tax=Andrographis paniculata TaxID=175694 RepID=UPI0021E7894C|nr:serine carboxypeptidase-like 18 isoform X3 [Andrographis paniculata]
MMRYYYCRIVVVFFFFIWIKDLFGRAEASPVEFLPGFDGPLPFHLETGYIGVDEGENVELFYYFVRSSSSSNGNDDPLILWLVGGPGCSGLSALLYEIGPLFIDKGEDEGLPKLSLNPYAWTKLTNIIFLDLPVGTGFSYAKTLNAAHSTGSQSCHQAYQFLRKWLIDHPEFASNPFYIGGSSYTGMTVPFIARLISDGNEAGVEPRINIKGYVLGNGATFPDEGNYKIPFAHGMGLISDELYESLMQTCEGNYVNVDSSNHPCLDNLDTFHQLVDDLSGEQILDPTCERIDSRSSRNGHRVLYNEERICTKKCYTYRHQYVPIWANNPSVQEALHIRENYNMRRGALLDCGSDVTVVCLTLMGRGIALLFTRILARKAIDHLYIAVTTTWLCLSFRRKRGLDLLTIRLWMSGDNGLYVGKLPGTRGLTPIT